MTLLQEGKQCYVFLVLTLQILLFFNSPKLDLLEEERREKEREELKRIVKIKRSKMTRLREHKNKNESRILEKGDKIQGLL